MATSARKIRTRNVSIKAASYKVSPPLWGAYFICGTKLDRFARGWRRQRRAGCGTLLRRLRHAVLVLTSGGTQRAKSETLAHSLVDLCAVAPFVWRESHHRLVYLGRNGQRAVGRLFGPWPRDRKRLCCRWPRGLDPRRSSHFAPKFLICLKIRIAGSPSWTIFARLRSLAGNIIALTTAERSFIVP